VALGNDAGSPDGIRDDELEVIRRELLTRLRPRSREVEEGIVAAALGVEPGIAEDPDRLAGLRAAARESLGLIGELIAQGVDWQQKMPAAVTAQARYLARGGVPLEVVLRGHYAMIGACLEFATGEIAELPQGTLPYLIEVQRRHGDYLMAAISTAYEDELERLRSPTARRLSERVERLLGGGADEGGVLDYDLGGWHLGLIGVGAELGLVARRLAERLGARLLILPRGGETAWVWLGAARPIPFAELERCLGIGDASDRSATGGAVRFAAGEPRQGIEGWRLTHREARIAAEVAEEGGQALVRCADVLLLAATARNTEIAEMLIDVYLAPLDADKDGPRLRETLRAYYAGDCNAASAAAALGVDRQTVRRRLRKIEAALGRPLDGCRVEMEMALRVEAYLHRGA
jgi:hypothetical protein